ncbi:MAG: hypothetical protein KDA57_16585, partial [Planctomycetales bacterium]|nr:hypothetical protein [Planctomycetales bacterium]
MQRYVARLLLFTFLAAICLPQHVAADTSNAQETEQPEESTTQPAEVPVDQSTPVEGEVAAATAAAGEAEPEDPAYGIHSLLPQLASPNDPTLSAKLAEQSLVNLFQGAAEFSFPLTLPPGINGHTPQLALRYSSHQTRQNGSVGFGWDLELGAIRRVLHGPATTLYDGSNYLLSLPDLQGELTHIATTGGIESYALRREREFARIEHDTATDSWTVTRKDGRRYELGTSADSRTQSD